MLVIEGVEDPPPAGEVLRFGEEGDPLGSEDGVEADVPDEVVGGDSEEEAELVEGDEVDFCKFVVDVGDVGEEAVGGVVVEDAGPVDVLSAPSVINQSNYVIENVFNLLQLALPLPQQPDRPLNHSLRLLVAVEERVQLIHDVRLAVLLRRLKFFL